MSARAVTWLGKAIRFMGWGALGFFVLSGLFIAATDPAAMGTAVLTAGAGVIAWALFFLLDVIVAWIARIVSPKKKPA